MLTSAKDHSDKIINHTMQIPDPSHILSTASVVNIVPLADADQRRMHGAVLKREVQR